MTAPLGSLLEFPAIATDVGDDLPVEADDDRVRLVGAAVDQVQLGVGVPVGYCLANLWMFRLIKFVTIFTSHTNCIFLTWILYLINIFGMSCYCDHF